MVKMKLASYEQTLVLCEKTGVKPRLRTLAYWLFENEENVGFCIFSMEQNKCIIEFAKVSNSAFDLLDGLLKASIAYCFEKGAYYFVFSRTEDKSLFAPILEANELTDEPFPIEPVIGHCDHDCSNCAGCGE